ncbi:hypothetical protein GCM10025771_16020 [Niveibacterium umoris]|uniref:Uncharacterized protein n=1 Tax=Niveibacterium umoris TaxID=1193620 RepID=A0A840BSM5_9RHOO|nr:hypothetical protein [Niveibacterium umoris]MBB4014528.1 hypothetical protein [Niveibacterium umoris]
MLLMRVVFLLVGIGCVASVLAWLLTSNRRYLVVAKKLAQFAVVAALVFLGLLLLERALVPVL